MHDPLLGAVSRCPAAVVIGDYRALYFFFSLLFFVFCISFHGLDPLAFFDTELILKL
jgi:hypothetical protein